MKLPISNSTDLPEPAATGEPLPFRDSTPHAPVWKLRLIRTLAVVTLLYSVYYIGWRWASTLNPDALWFSIPLAAAETYGLLTSFLLVFTVWNLRRRTPVPAPEGLSVDVYITTYDEPLEIIRRTAIGAREIHYPHRTFVLDDGKREEVRTLADDLGIGYIRREGNEHAKAGNLNNAIKVTDGDYILQLDADHVPLPHILDRLLGFFSDPKVAFVQSPQDFYNTDSFTHDVNESGRRIWEEQRIFFSLIQPGKDHWNAAFFCGSCGVIRRSAIEEIGGFSVETITEDMETSLLLHARGWKSVYYGESLAYGLAPGSAGAFHVQRLRWGQGSMQILRKFNPLTYPGLTIPQRICYFASVISYLDGLQKLVLYLAPILFFLTGAFPIRVDNTEFFAHFIPYLVLSLAMFELLARGTGFLWIAERYNMAKFFTYILALSGYFARGKLKFNVTPKGAGHVPFKTYAPQLTLAVVSAVAVVFATLASQLGWMDYGVPGWGSVAFWVNFAWLAWNFGLACYVVQLSLYLQQQRSDHRFADRLPVRVRVRPRGTRKTTTVIGLTEDLNPSGIAFRSPEPIEPGSRVELVLPLATGQTRVKGKVLHSKPVRNGRMELYKHGVEFGKVPLDARDAIELHCTHHAVPIWRLQYREAVDFMDRAALWMQNARGEKRQIVRLPARVTIDGEELRSDGEAELAMLEETSASGARLLLRRPVAPGSPISFEVPGTAIHGAGTAVFSRALETPLGVRFAIGVRREAGRDHKQNKENDMSVRKLSSQVAGALVMVLAGAGALAEHAEAQWQAVGYAGVEFDDRDMSLYLAGTSVSPARVGISPVFNLVGYRLTYPVGGTTGGTSTVNAINPSAGLKYQVEGGAVQARAGYVAVSDADEGTRPIGVPGGGQDGATGTLQADYWGTGVRTAQGIVNYNFADEYLWSRARASQRVMGPLALGAEVVWQGGGDVPGEDYRAFQVAPVLEYGFTPNVRLTGAIGYKDDNLVRDETGGFAYYKLEILLIP